MLTSVSEPTFYYPVADIDTGNSEIYDSDCWRSEFTDPYWAKLAADRGKPFGDNAPCPKVKGDGTYRYYFGGFPMTAPFHDLKRIIPGLYAFSTGRTELGNTVNDVLAAYFNIQSDKAYLYNRYWVDLETQPTAQQVADMNNYDVTADVIIGQAIEKAKSCVSADLTSRGSCRPPNVLDRYQNEVSVLAPTNPRDTVSRSGKPMVQSRSLKDAGLTLPTGH